MENKKHIEVMSMNRWNSQKHIKRGAESTVAPRAAYPKLTVSPDKGLTDEQVRQLHDAGWGNTAVESPTKSDRQIIRENIFTYFNLIFVILAVCLSLVGEWKNMTFLGVIVCNSAIGIFQQLRAKRTIDKLTLLSESKVTVLRDGNLQPVPPRDLVRGDIVQLGAGNQIPADALVLSGEVQVNEGLITGEADAIAKAAGDTLLSGSFVLAGQCRCRLEQVGADAYAARLTHAAKLDGGKKQKSEMMRSLDRLIQFIGIALIPISILLFHNMYFRQGLPLNQSVSATVAALIGMIPEGLFLLTSVALAVSVVRLANHRTLIHEMNAIETLARVDTLCVDKTGTITSPEMHVREVVALSDADSKEILGAIYNFLPADNDTARTLQQAFSKNPGWKAESSVPFTSATKWSSVTFAEHGTYLVGAPEYILGENISDLSDTIAPFTESGCRVLLLAACDGAESGKFFGQPTPLALVVLENPIRENAPEVFQYFKSQGVAIKVISGDNPVTVSAVAVQAGIEGADRWIDARELQTEADIAKAIGEYTVFGRVAPNQKQQIVKALQAAGHTVAMTGDGVNDVLALKDADCGIAMASGAEAASQVAQLVLLDSDFAALPMVVAEGRRVINNIQRASALYLVKNILSFFLAVITLFTVVPYPFVPIQLTLISALTIGVPSFFLALQPNHDLVKGKFMLNVLRRACPGGLTAVMIILYAELFTYATGLSNSELSTICVVLMTVNGLSVLYYTARPLNAMRTVLLISMTVCSFAAIILAPGFFSLAAPSFTGWLVLIALASLVYPFQTTVETLFQRISDSVERKREKRLAKQR